MSVSGFRVPKRQHHKASGQARVRLRGKDLYLGPWGSPEADAKYRKVIAEYLVFGQVRQAQRVQPRCLSINELVVAFFEHADRHYVKNGRITNEVACFKSAVRPLVSLYGLTQVDEFGPLALKAVREQMILKGWTRNYINKSVSRLRHIFKWGVENELVPPTTLQSLQAVQGLQAGRCEAPDNPKRHPLSQEHIDAVKVLVSERVRDLIELQLMTGARPGELLLLTTGSIDMSDPEVWTARLEDHKTAHHGKGRVIPFGPNSQLIVRRYFKVDRGAKLFEIKLGSYRAAVAAACTKADVPHWTPHWLRHTAATRIREKFGLEAAQAMLGHSKMDMTEHYAQKNSAAARQAALAAG